MLFVIRKNLEFGVKTSQTKERKNKMDKKFILTEKTRKLIKDFIMNKCYPKVIIILNNLPEFKDEFFIEMKNLVRNTGRSNIVSLSEIKDIIEKYEVGDAKPDEN